MELRDVVRGRAIAIIELVRPGVVITPNEIDPVADEIAEHTAEAVAAALEQACKQFCSLCLQGYPMDECALNVYGEKKHYHDIRAMHITGLELLWCSAAKIRALIPDAQTALAERDKRIRNTEAELQIAHCNKRVESAEYQSADRERAVEAAALREAAATVHPEDFDTGSSENCALSAVQHAIEALITPTRQLALDRAVAKARLAEAKWCKQCLLFGMVGEVKDSWDRHITELEARVKE